MVRSHLDYCSSVWFPYRKGDMEDIEKVKKKATKLIHELKHMNYYRPISAYTTLLKNTRRHD